VVEAMGLKSVALTLPTMASPPYKFHPNLSTDSKVTEGGGARLPTYTRTAW
jgi:hypothetical protein